MGLLSARIDAYKQQLAQLTAQQSHLEEVEQKVAQRVEQFRSQKEMVKAQYQAAQAQVNVNEAVTGISNEMTRSLPNTMSRRNLLHSSNKCALRNW